MTQDDIGLHNPPDELGDALTVHGPGRFIKVGEDKARREALVDAL